MSKTLVITGGSSGIGKATAELFAAKGYQVFELSRHGQNQSAITHITCDVTSEESCRQAIGAVLAQTGHIDVLISNAGFGISGAIEFTETEDAKRLFDVNFFGALNITKAVLPQLRKQHSGRILYTSSVAAVLPVPYQSFYSASKSAIDAMALCLRNEVKSFGIEVACLLPGDVKTGFTAAREKSVAGSEVYGNIEHAVANMEKDEQGGMTPQQMARIFYHMAQTRCLRTYYIGGALYKVFHLLNKLLPVTLVNWIEGKLYS